MKYYSILKQKGYSEHEIWHVREKFKRKFKLWSWDNIEPAQMLEVEEYVNNLKDKNESN